ncbi:MAG TPA: restriction endonuclease [Fusobacteriaceae bacterium]|jgi:5-methylcytosine-specific restriction protein A|nr:restriction endonuclease [Fusobacteriaceae bacterium]
MTIKDLKIDQVLENKEIAECFLCSNQGGIRKSKRTNTIILLAKFDNCSYKHRKDKDILYFTGMGKKGDQEMKRQNKSLLNAKKEGFAIHLLELYKEKEYIYKGEVELISNPIIERQLDDNKEERDVFMFPLKLK